MRSYIAKTKNDTSKFNRKRPHYTNKMVESTWDVFLLSLRARIKSLDARIPVVFVLPISISGRLLHYVGKKYQYILGTRLANMNLLCKYPKSLPLE